MDRESIINSLVDKRREQLDELDNVDLLGRETLDEAREEAIQERLIRLRDDLRYGSSDDELLGEEGVTEMRWEAIEAQAESYTAELESMTDEELSALMGGRQT